jgi:hypothetical protein
MGDGDVGVRVRTMLLVKTDEVLDDFSSLSFSFPFLSSFTGLTGVGRVASDLGASSGVFAGAGRAVERPNPSQRKGENPS